MGPEETSTTSNRVVSKYMAPCNPHILYETYLAFGLDL
jgi:hypothetical protein